MDEKFYLERKEIGVGAWGKVYLWDGFAYKCFDNTYSTESIEYEIQIQNEINKTDLHTVRYYEKDDPFIIKMDYIEGITLAERISHKSYGQGMEDFISLQKQVHKVHNINIPMLRSLAETLINCSTVPDMKKERALQYLYEINETANLCHLDFHPLNIMFSNDKYYIIDWYSARLGNPVIDYARTYLLLFEHAYDLSQTYINLLRKDNTIDMSDFDKAIYIAVFASLNDRNYERLRHFLE